MFVVVGGLERLVTTEVWQKVAIVLYFSVSLGVHMYGMYYVYRRIGLACPYCGTRLTTQMTYAYSQMDSTRAAENARRCARCHAVIIDLEK